MPESRSFCPVPVGEGARWLAVGEDGAIWVSEGTGSANALGCISAERAANACPQS